MLLEWALGYVAGKAADGFFSLLKRNPLSKDLERSLEAWREALPTDEALSSIHALFPDQLADMAVEDRPALLRLRARIRSGHLPSEQDWIEALFEQWRYIRSSVDSPQAFFLIEENTARQRIGDLGARLFNTTAVHAHLFNPEALRLLKRINDDVAVIRDRLDDAPLAAVKASDEFAKWMEHVDGIRDAFDRAMSLKEPWPGEHYDLVMTENVFYLKLYAFLTNHGEDPSALDDLRQIDPVDDRWDPLRKRLMSRIVELEAGPSATVNRPADP